MLRTIHAVSSLLLGIGLLLMGLALLSTALGIRAVEEGFSDTVTGLVMASYFGGFIAGGYLVPDMIRRIGPIRSFAVLAAIASASAFLPTLLVHPVLWAVLRFVIGICLVGLYMVLESWLNSLASNDKRAQIFAVYMIVTLGAHALGQFLLLLDPGAQANAFGIAAIFFSLGLVPVALTRLPEPQPVATPSLHLKQLYEISPLSVAGAFAGGLATSSFWALGAVYAYRSEMSALQIVLFMSITIMGGVILQWPIGRLSDHIDRRKILLLVTLLSVLAALIAATLPAGEFIWLYITVFLLGGMMFPIYSLSVAYLNDRISSEDSLDASRGLLLMYGGGALLGPILAGESMRQTGPNGLFYYIAVILLLFVLFTIRRMQTSDPTPEAERSVFVPMTRTSQVVLEMDPRVDSELSEAETDSTQILHDKASG